MEESFSLKTFKHTATILSQIMDYHESESIAYIVMEKAFRLNKIEIITNKSFSPNDTQQLKYQVIMSRLATHEPIQYILKEADFYGRKFYVNPSVLIPRQETEMLIQLVKGNREWHNPKIADIGVGSGCIACTLALEIPGSEVFGYDISSDALKVAQQNASHLSAGVHLRELDILNSPIEEKDFDIMVSNPPYVTLGEKVHMMRNVLEFEPHEALFVGDDDPLMFYKSILIKAKTALKHGGLIFFEINEQFGKNMLLLFQHFGLEDPKIHKDLNDKQRFASAVMP